MYRSHPYLLTTFSTSFPDYMCLYTIFLISLHDKFIFSGKHTSAHLLLSLSTTLLVIKNTFLTKWYTLSYLPCFAIFLLQLFLLVVFPVSNRYIGLSVTLGYHCFLYSHCYYFLKEFLGRSGRHLQTFNT